MGDEAAAQRLEGIAIAKDAIEKAHYPAHIRWSEVAATAAFDALVAWIGERGPRSELLRAAFLDGMDRICSAPSEDKLGGVPRILARPDGVVPYRTTSS